MDDYKLAKEKEDNSTATEDLLLNTRSNSETTSFSKDTNSTCSNNKSRKCSTCCNLSGTIILYTIAILFLIWTPFNILMDSRLEMIPGLPPFEWWLKPPDEVRLRAYVFNVTNSKEFLEGTDEKMKMEEIGPIIYLEKLVHKNVKFNENGTLSYTANRSAIYLPEENTINLNSTIIIPNYAVLGIATYLHDASFLTKMAFNVLLKSVKSPIFVEITLHDFLWNLTDPILSVAKHFAPDIIRDENIGILHMIYRNFEDRSTVFITNKNGHEKFFLLDKFDGSEYLPGHGETCQDLIVNSTEGALYPQYIQKNTTLRYWRKTLCKVTILHYEKDKYLEEYGVNTYKFTKDNNTYDRKENIELDCYKGSPILPSGLFDVSRCYNGIGMAASYPHYLFASEEVQNYVDGLKPNITQHESFLYVEPLTGIPVTSTARSQSNLVVRDTTGFTADLRKFSNIAIPMFWIEYNQVGLPNYVRYLLYFTVNIVPNYQYCFIIFVLIVGTIFLVRFCRNIYTVRSINGYENNTTLQFENEKFLKNK